MSTPVLSVVALSVGTPAKHNIHGHETLTSIVRTPFAGPITVNPEQGIASHQSAIHDAQIYAFFWHHYAYWTKKLGIERSAWDWCHWDENLMLSTSMPLNEAAVFEGDVWEFQGDDGECIRLQVCGTRVPCSRLAWRCGQKGDWLTDVSKTGFCGMYLRVLQGGKLRAGQKGRIIPCEGAVKVPVSSIPYCMMAPVTDPSTQELALQIFQHPGLQNMIRKYLIRKLSMIGDQTIGGRNTWKGWRQMHISKITPESEDVKSFHLEPGLLTDSQLSSWPIHTYSASLWIGSKLVYLLLG